VTGKASTKSLSIRLPLAVSGGDKEEEEEEGVP